MLIFTFIINSVLFKSIYSQDLSAINIVNSGTGYADGYDLTISAPDLPGGVQATNRRPFLGRRRREASGSMKA
jgi:hypothetical protein